MSLQPLRRRLHQGRMERRAHRQRHRALRAARLAFLDRALDRALLAGDHDLSRRVEVHRLHRAAGLAARGNDVLVLQVEDRRHRALPGRHGVLHGLCTEMHERQRVGKADRAGGRERGVLAQAMPCPKLRCRAAERAPSAVRGIACGGHRGLRIDRLVERLGRSFVEQAQELIAERFARLSAHLVERRHAGIAFQHAHRLGALAGKHHRELHSAIVITSGATSPT